jgi:hypothetical protein
MATGRRARLDRQRLDPERLAAIAQPVSVCHQWSMTGLPSSLGPVQGVRIAALAGEEQVCKPD